MWLVLTAIQEICLSLIVDKITGTVFNVSVAWCEHTSFCGMAWPHFFLCHSVSTGPSVAWFEHRSRGMVSTQVLLCHGMSTGPVAIVSTQVLLWHGVSTGAMAWCQHRSCGMVWAQVQWHGVDTGPSVNLMFVSIKKRKTFVPFLKLFN